MKIRYFMLIYIITISILFASCDYINKKAASYQKPNPVKQVNPLMRKASIFEFSYGNVCPS